MRKKIALLIFLIIAALAVGFIFLNNHTAKVEAGEEDDNVYGWAWSENIGWISFNNTSGGGGINYGVNIDPANGLFSGYAWSRGTTADVGGIGWITFNENQLSGCPSSLCRAWVDLDTGRVSGWARAYRPISPEGQDLGGWTGWINLDEVWIDTSVSPAEFRGWAWGGGGTGASIEERKASAVVGWISLNCKEGGYNEATGEVYDICSTSDYKVMVDLNQPPNVFNAEITGELYCNILPGVGRISFQWTYTDADDDNQTEYHLQIATDGGFNNLVVDSYNSQTVPSGEKGTSAVTVRENPTEDLDVGYNRTYYWRVRVKDTFGNWSAFANGEPFSFSTPAHAYPWIDFTWAPQEPAVDELTQFADQSTVYGGADKESWLWEIPDWAFEEGFDSSNQNPLGKFETAGEKNVSLSVFDSSGYFCPGSKSITSQLPLPEWREIAPF